MDIDARIAQWENMTQADPENSMGWFSLGTAYKEANREADAAGPLRKAIELDEGLSRAYQLLSQVLITLEQHEEAGQVLTKGYRIAAERGDVMPMRAMESLLNKIGLPIPMIKQPAAPTEIGGDQIVDRRTGRPGTRMKNPPIRGPIGKYVRDHYSKETWAEWKAMGTKVINEMRLDFSNPAHCDMYDQQMFEWLGFTRQEAEEYAASL